MLLTNAVAGDQHSDVIETVSRIRRTRAADRTDADRHRVVGGGPAMRTVLAEVDCVAPTMTPVLITGETGTGKDLLARRVHERSDRAGGAWIHVDCTTLTHELMEAELYGHVRGAFTGAAADRTGRAKLADGGTLFLNEIGELPLEQQCKLLRLIQDQEFEPLGSSRTVRVDVRIVAATNRDLHAEVAAGRFRADLYYRLAAFPISVPALRDRMEDLRELVEWMLRRQLQSMNRNIEVLPPGVLAALRGHSWPGNVRELRSVVERACIRSSGRCLMPADFDLVGGCAPAPARGLGGGAACHARTLREVEAEHIQSMLALSGGVVEGRNGAAALLGLSPSTLRFRLRRLGISLEKFRNVASDHRESSLVACVR